jgi:hypothetical protein
VPAKIGFVFSISFSRFTARNTQLAERRTNKFGFVFSCPTERIIAITTFQINTYANLLARQIGFVFSNWFFKSTAVLGANGNWI